MEIDASYGTAAMAKTAVERLDYQCQGRCWGCGLHGYIRSKCPTNPSKPAFLAVAEGEDLKVDELEKVRARD